MKIGYFDGACNPNPGGEMGMGATILDADNNEIDWSYAYRKVGTNNQSEYLAVILLLKRALYLGIDEITCRGDSKLVINQINGVYQCHSQQLVPLLDKTMALKEQFKVINFEWVKRSLNSRADHLSKLGFSEKKNAYSTGNTAAVQDIAPEEEQSVQDLVPVNKVLPSISRIKVKQLSEGRFLITDSESSTIFDSKNMSCSCHAFHANSACMHITNFIRLQTDTNKWRHLSN